MQVKTPTSQPAETNAPKIALANAQFVPVCFSRLSDEALSGLPLYMRTLDDLGREKFTLYAAADVKFSSEHRIRLERLGVTFIHILSRDQIQLRRQLEESIQTIASNSSADLAGRCEIIYESSRELIDEMLTSLNLKDANSRIKRVSGAIVSLHIESPKAFSHLFTAARHDASPATHAANAAVWIPALALSLGIVDPSALCTLCKGAMLYDIGMAYVPPHIFNHRGKLNSSQKQQIQQHPETGAQLLRQLPFLDQIITTMALQHHERLDGSGYPRKLSFDQIHQVARMIAVIDSFNALTSFRPYREQGVTPTQALETLRRETPDRYDPRIVTAWTKLLQDAFPEMIAETPSKKPADAERRDSRRRFQRYSTNCPALLRSLKLVSGMWTEKETFDVVAHNLSRGGLGLLSRTTLSSGDYYRVILQGKDGVGRPLNGVIVRVGVRPDGLFDAGMRFVDLEKEAAPLPQGDFEEPQKPLAPEEDNLDGDFIAP